MESKVLNDRYRLIELVGTGGMATVYRGRDLLLDRTVAVKALREPYASDPDFRDRFMAEARAAGRLDHPHIVHIYDVGVDDGTPFIIMEMVQGTDLKKLIREEAPLTAEEALGITQQICTAVGYAHRTGLVHCDLKPQNILLNPEGKVKVTDFGIARAFHEEQPVGEKEHIIWGSPHYISPEQAAGEPPVPASDVYSIGIILYEMLTGVPPFHAEDTGELLAKHLQEEPVPLRSFNPQVPPRLESLVSKVLAKDPARRYRNADQFYIAIEEYVRQGSEPPAAEIKRAQTTTPLQRQGSVAPGRAAATTPLSAKPQSTRSQPEPQTEETGTDWLLWLLWSVAAIAVLGLVPLWFFVYQAYTQPVLPPTDTPVGTPTVTPVGESVGVPNLVGLSAADAQRLAETYNLDFAVEGERETNEYLPGTVLQQEPTAGAQAAVNTTVKVVVAAGRAFTLPDLVGYRNNVVISDLEVQGLVVVQREIWSTETKGLILEQEPPPNTEIRAGETVTLTVSGGTEQTIPLQVNLNNSIFLEEALIPQIPFQPGDNIPVTLRWRALQPIDRSYTVFVHLLTLDMELLAQDDNEPGNGTSPTHTWRPEEIIIDPHQVLIPSGAPTGTYQIRVGLYAGDARLEVLDPGQTQVQDNSIFVTNVEIAP